MIDIASAISLTSGLLGAAKTAIAARDEAKAQQAIADVQMKLLDVSTAALSLIQTNISLTDEIRLLKDENKQLQMKASEREGYTLSEISSGVYAYKSKPSEEGTDPPLHYMCQPCYDKGVKSVLRLHRHDADQWTAVHRSWHCPENRHHDFSSFP